MINCNLFISADKLYINRFGSLYCSIVVNSKVHTQNEFLKCHTFECKFAIKKQRFSDTVSDLGSALGTHEDSSPIASHTD